MMTGQEARPEKEGKTMTTRNYWGSSIRQAILFAGAAFMMTAPASAAHFGAGIGFGPAFGPWGYWNRPLVYGTVPIAAHPNTGTLKLDTSVKGAEVFVDGALTGTTGTLKSVRLQPGAHDLAIRSEGRAEFDEQIFVVNGKTLHVHPELQMEPKS
jgi:hypothetical protein